MVTLSTRTKPTTGFRTASAGTPIAWIDGKCSRPREVNVTTASALMGTWHAASPSAEATPRMSKDCPLFSSERPKAFDQAVAYVSGIAAQWVPRQEVLDGQEVRHQYAGVFGLSPRYQTT